MHEVTYQAGVERLLASYRAVPAGATVRLAKKNSNLFRARAENTAPGLDVSGLTQVISIDPEARTADVAGMCTYEDLLAATLPHGLTPLVVPQLKTITLGGAVTGLGIEASSFRNGLPHESVLEMDILTGSGEILTASPDGEYADLYYGFPNSYGTLGYATRLRIELEKVPPFVALRYVRFRDLGELQRALADICRDKKWEGERVDYVDGVVFPRDESYAVLGRQTSEYGPTSDYTGMQCYYQAIRHGGNTPLRDRLTIDDYLWRWDTDWFWCSRAFGVQNPIIRRLWPKKYRRSSVYWKLVALDRRFGIGDKIQARKGEPPLERVVQDIEIPIERTTDFLEWFLREIPIEPLWLCPLRLRESAAAGDSGFPWPLYPLEPDRCYVNVGFWSAVPREQNAPTGAANRAIEKKVSELGGHKSLYSDSFYEPEEFAAHYGGTQYVNLRQRYDPEQRLLDLYAKAVKQK